jgi:hypothetical protein
MLAFSPTNARTVQAPTRKGSSKLPLPTRFSANVGNACSATSARMGLRTTAPHPCRERALPGTVGSPARQGETQLLQDDFYPA